jgi:predicted dienelactone hydrolase
MVSLPVERSATQRPPARGSPRHGARAIAGWTGGGLAGLLLAGVLAFVLASATAFHTTRPVGFQRVAAPVQGGQRLTAAVWYPTNGHPWPSVLGLNVQDVATDAPPIGHDLPLIVIAQGKGCDPCNHTDTALALAQAGFVVVAPMVLDGEAASEAPMSDPAWTVERTRSIPAAVDFMLRRWPHRDQLDPARIGVFGFSAGGFAGLAAIGGRPDLSRLIPHCARSAELACRIWPLASARLPGPDAFVHDPRIKAAVIVAPGLGFTFGPHSLSRVSAPVQLWSGDADQTAPPATNVEPVRQALGPRVEYHSTPGAGHFAFLEPCGLIAPAPLCRDAGGFDRRRFHRYLNAEVVRFFRARL